MTYNELKLLKLLKRRPKLTQKDLKLMQKDPKQANATQKET